MANKHSLVLDLGFLKPSIILSLNMSCLQARRVSALLRAQCLRVSLQSYRTKTLHQSSKHANDKLFRYTSGRWMYVLYHFPKQRQFQILICRSYNEHLRLAERYHKFNIPPLLEITANACNRQTTDITSFTKLSEGGFNRIFQLTFSDGKCVLARLPYPTTMPRYYTVASEAATLDFLRGHGIRTPEVYVYCSRAGEGGDGNPVGAEYIIMEKLDGIPLGEVWYTMTPDEQFKVMRQVVELEARIMGFDLPAFGSIYYQKDLPTERNVPLEGAFCIGPMAHWSWWNGGRSNLNIDRGPCKHKQE